MVLRKEELTTGVDMLQTGDCGIFVNQGWCGLKKHQYPITD